MIFTILRSKNVFIVGLVIAAACLPGVCWMKDMKTQTETSLSDHGERRHPVDSPP